MILQKRFLKRFQMCKNVFAKTEFKIVDRQKNPPYRLFTSIGKVRRTIEKGNRDA